MRLNALTLRVDEAAKVLRVHRTTVLRSIHRGELLAFQLGSSWRIPRIALEPGSHTQCPAARAACQFALALPTDELLKPSEVRQALRCSNSELATLALHPIEIGRQQRYLRAEVLAWLRGALGLDEGPDETSAPEAPPVEG